MYSEHKCLKLNLQFASTDTIYACQKISCNLNSIFNPFQFDFQVFLNRYICFAITVIGYCNAYHDCFRQIGSVGKQSKTLFAYIVCFFFFFTKTTASTAAAADTTTAATITITVTTFELLFSLFFMKFCLVELFETVAASGS